MNLYPLRASLGAVLHPREPLLLQSQRGTDLTVSTLDGDDAHRVLDFGLPRNRRIGFSWSRDGEWIAFSRGGASAMFNGPTDGDVFKIRPDGTQLANLTPDSSADDDGYPSFSGNGEWIVFRSGRGGRYELYLIRTDGSQRRQFTHDGANALFPAFSPTANRIAFLSNRAEPGSMLYDVYLADVTAD